MHRPKPRTGRNTPPLTRVIKGGTTPEVITRSHTNNRQQANRKQATGKPSTKKRLYVLDTNVIMHDPSCILMFQEHDIHIPSMVLEELDNHKKGNEEINRNVRAFFRTLNDLISANNSCIKDGISLKKISGGKSTGLLYLQFDITEISTKPDNVILLTVRKLQEMKKHSQVVLVSKDINMRIKAMALGMQAEDYSNDIVLEDTDLLYPGFKVIPEDFWERNEEDLQVTRKGTSHTYRLEKDSWTKRLHVNEFIHSEDGTFIARVVTADSRITQLKTIHNYIHKPTFGIVARNREQNYALNLLLDKDIDLVSLAGQAGSGKTLVTLAAALYQVIETESYSEVIFTRVTVPVGEDIGFLPGNEDDKMAPWAGPLHDNLDVIAEHHRKQGAAMIDLIRSRIKVKAMSFMRGRTFLNKFLIIDEAQNLTPKQMKTLITRAGPGTKVVCLGNLAQIDTPYLTEGSSGFAYLIERFKGWEFFGHVTLQKGERSRLANHANDVM